MYSMFNFCFFKFCFSSFNCLNHNRSPKLYLRIDTFCLNIQSMIDAFGCNSKPQWPFLWSKPPKKMLLTHTKALLTQLCPIQCWLLLLPLRTVCPSIFRCVFFTLTALNIPNRSIQLLLPFDKCFVKSIFRWNPIDFFENKNSEPNKIPQKK